jgi:hypothetical protein
VEGTVVLPTASLVGAVAGDTVRSSIVFALPSGFTFPLNVQTSLLTTSGLTVSSPVTPLAVVPEPGRGHSSPWGSPARVPPLAGGAPISPPLRANARQRNWRAPGSTTARELEPVQRQAESPRRTPRAAAPPSPRPARAEQSRLWAEMRVRRCPPGCPTCDAR